MFQKLNVRHEYHRRQSVDASSPAYNPTRPLLRKYPQRELGDAFRSSLVAEQTIHNLNKATERNGFLSQKAGLGTSTDFRRWHPDRFAADVCRSNLNYLPTSVGRIQEANSLASARQESRLPSLKQLMLIVLALLISASAAMAQTPSFTYQGRLTDGGTPANGNYDLQFALFDNSAGGTQVGSTQTLSTVLVVNGGFTVNLDFGVSAFPGANRFLEIGARLSGGGAFTILAPRQPITSTPYAVRSLNASSADTIPANALPAGNANYIQNNTATQASANFNISGNGMAGGTLSGNVVNAGAQYNIAGQRLLSNTGTNNLFAGVGAGLNTTGNGFNAFFGSSAGRSNTTGDRNSFFGALAGANNTTGAFNSFFGFFSGTSNTADHNSFFGSLAGANNTTGGSNSFFGDNAGSSNVTGVANSFFGSRAGANSTAGFGSGENSFFGSFAGEFNTTGIQNSFFGDNAGSNTDTGGQNAFFGYRAGIGNKSGSRNTAIGTDSSVGSNLTNATAIGSRARVDQSNSLVLGSIKGVNDAADNTKVGIGTTAPLATLHVVSFSNGGADNTATFRNSSIGPNQSHIHYGANGDWYIRSAASAGNVVLQDTGGNVGIGTASPFRKFHVRFGTDQNLLLDSSSGGGVLFASVTDDNVTSKPFLLVGSPIILFPNYTGLGPGVGINTTTPDSTLTVNGPADKPGGGSWDTFSDERLKNIKGRFTPGLKAVMQLQPVRYEYKPDNALGLKSSGEYIGFGAQAVQKIIPEAVSKNDKGYLLVNNDPILWTMLNAIKEQQQQLQQKRVRIEKLEARLATLEMMVRKISVKQRRRR